jgi:hypothetical protein
VTPEPTGDGRDHSVEGRYANTFHVGHNAVEFVIGFGQYFPDDANEQMHTRIITSPAYARELLQVLTAAIREYEQAFGTIEPVR